LLEAVGNYSCDGQREREIEEEIGYAPQRVQPHLDSHRPMGIVNIMQPCCGGGAHEDILEQQDVSLMKNMWRHLCMDERMWPAGHA
jgi:hypothetical protein